MHAGIRTRTMVYLALAVSLSLPLVGCAKKAGNTDVVTDASKDRNGTGAGGDNADGSGTKNPGGSESGNKGDQFGLKDVFFNYDDATLSAEARDQLADNASILGEMSALKVLIEGHCDERGTVEYNLALGQRRADAARNYLVNSGVDGMRLTPRSLGEERPFAFGTDESAWSQNRRAHFVVTNK